MGLLGTWFRNHHMPAASSISMMTKPFPSTAPYPVSGANQTVVLYELNSNNYYVGGPISTALLRPRKTGPHHVNDLTARGKNRVS